MNNMYFKRVIDNDLLAWSKEADHKPVLLRRRLFEIYTGVFVL